MKLHNHATSTEPTTASADLNEINSLMIMCTDSCQLACTYCEVDTSNANMTTDTLFKSIDLLLTTKSKMCQLRFWGGEPLLRWEFIKTGISYGIKAASLKEKTIQFMITTNGILLDKTKIAFLKKNPVEIMFSFDGDEKINNCHRIAKTKNKTYFKQIENNLKFLIKNRIPHFINMVITPKTVSCVKEGLDYLKKTGVSRVQIAYQCGILWSKQKINVLIAKIDEFLISNPDKTFIMNFVNDCEPISLSQEIIIDCDGKIYFDAARFMEKKFRHLKQSFLLGDIKRKYEIDTFFKTKKQLLNLFKNGASKKSIKIFKNNIKLGLMLDFFFRSHPIEPLKSNEHPFFTSIIRGSLSSQRKALNEIGIKTLFLYLEGPCINNCLFCGQKYNLKFSDAFQIENRLKENNKIKAKKIAIVGNEPLLHPNIEEIVTFCKKSGFSQIELLTSGARFEDTIFTKNVKKAGLTSISLPLYAAEPKLHDYIVGRKGSFVSTIKGIANARKYEITVYAHSNLIKQNINHIIRLEHFVNLKLGLPFVVFPIRPKTSGIPFENLIFPYNEMIDRLKGINSLVGFPLCILKRIQKDYLKSGECISDSMKLYFLDQKFIKLSACKNCKYIKTCSGLFHDYIKIYGSKYIEPIQ